MKKSFIIIALGFLLILSLSLVYSESNETYPCGKGTDNQACICISQPVTIPECTIIPVYSSNGCLSSYNVNCNNTIQCYEDNDCGTSTETRYCDGSAACVKTTSYKCENPGTFNSKCSPIAGISCGICPNGCENGYCAQVNQTCSDKCGDGICQNVVCSGIGCPCEESASNCQKDCNLEQISEQVKCIFKNSKEMQKCYLSVYNDKFFCSGIETCTMDVNGYYGEKLTWKSSCGGYAYTLIDGNSEYAEFDCSGIIGDCNSQQCEDGSYNSCYKDSNGYCTCSTCPPIIVKPVCGNGICESGEGMICEIEACKQGEKCQVSEGKCFYVCEQDCKNIPGIYAKLNEKFKLQVSQTVKITDYKEIKILFRDLLTSQCEAGVTTSSEVKSKLTGYAVAEETPATSSSAAGGSGVNIIKCPNVGPMAQLEIINPEEMGRKILTLKLNEAKQVYNVNVVFLGYDFASRTGTFVVNSQTTTCPINCKCNSEGYILGCKPEINCKEEEVLCPDGVCREKCEINNMTNCDYGCLYNNKCLSIGIRVKGLYCGLEGTLTNQLSSDKSCENNFECESNVCAGGKCISSGLIQKIIDWFKKLFG